MNLGKDIRELDEIAFDGKGVVVRYSFGDSRRDPGYTAQVEVLLDGRLAETVVLPMDENSRKQELYYKYNLPDGGHSLSFRWLNPRADKSIELTSYIVYTDKK